ncbi:MAG: hypothetical protein V1799_10135 [bacterium]
MITTEHRFHIPVMGTGFSADTPIRVAPFGISSVISIVDDLLLERIREHYHRLFDMPYKKIQRYEEDGRAKRITAYLEMVQEIVRQKMESLKSLSLSEENDKSKYFAMLPDESILKQKYLLFLHSSHPAERTDLERELTEKMKPGSIDVNIMTKLDKVNTTRLGEILSDEYTDAKAALRGYANSTLHSSIIFSAGLNQGLFNYITRFRDFYRNEVGEIKKNIVLKVSDFRSALIQGKILAKKGLEVGEFRIESGLNCGGHAFASNGYLLPPILKEFSEKRHQIAEECKPLVKKFYESMGWHYNDLAVSSEPLVTVQGGIGTHGEDQRLRDVFNVDRTGWASPFLLVPEATLVDNATRELLRNAKEEDLFLSNVSPLGVPFNTVSGSGSIRWTAEQAQRGTPGSPCPKGFLKSNREYTDQPICTASREFQNLKLAEITTNSHLDETQKDELTAKTHQKTCLCAHLGNSALIALGLEEERNAPQSICPGPNIAWFNRYYSLREMIDHIYGRGPSLVPQERPHMFAKEIEMYVDYFGRLVKQCMGTRKELQKLREFKENLVEGMDYCLELAAATPNQNENLSSIPPVVEKQRSRLLKHYDELIGSFVPALTGV